MTGDSSNEPNLPPGPARDLVDLFARLRASQGMPSQLQIARRTGLSPGFVSEVIRGVKPPSPDSAAKIVRVLDGDQATVMRARHLAEAWHELNQYSRRRDAQRHPPAMVTGPVPAHEPRLPAPASRRRAARRLLTSAGIPALASMLTATTISFAADSDRAVWLTGSVSCRSGRPVVGVWIAAAAGQEDSGFAHLGPTPGRQTDDVGGRTVSYSYRLPHRGPYVLHVGCGGTAHDWASRNYSGQFTRTAIAIRCADPPPARPARTVPRGTCESAS